MVPTQKLSQFLLALCGTFLFLFPPSQLDAQSLNDGPIRLEVRLQQVYARSYEDITGNAEQTWFFWAQDAANLDGQGWRGGACITQSVGSGSFPYTSGNLNQVLMDHTYGGAVPLYYQLRTDSWEDDCPTGNACTFDSNSFTCLADADDARCNQSNFAGNIAFRNNSPGQWNNDGFRFSCGGQYGVRTESRWRYTRGDLISDPYPLGTFNCDPATVTHLNNTSTYSNSTGSPRGAKDVYYSFTVQQPSNVVISTCGANSNFDTYLFLQTTGGGALANNDDDAGCTFSPARSTINYTNLAPGTYHIVVEAFGNNQQGVFDLSLDVTPNAQTVDFSGLPASTCVNNSNTTLVGSPSGGAFSGPGVSGSTFSPASAGIGTHNVTYTVTGPGFDNYTATQIPFSTISGGGTTISLSDNQISGAVPLGFNFEFYDNTYTSAYISSNGFLSFSAGQFHGCCSGQSLPNGLSPNNLVAFAWEDLDPGNGLQGIGDNLMWYTTVGVSPNREFRLTFWRVDHFPDGNNVTARVRLFESSNNIEIHTGIMPSDGGNHTMGIENSDGTKASVVPGRNRTNWSTGNNAWRFTPPGLCGPTVTKQVTVNPLPDAAFANPSPVCSNQSVTLVPTQSGGTFSGAGITGNSFNGSVGAGTYTITYTLTDGNGCTNTSTQSINVITAPTASATATSVSCLNVSDGTATANPASGVTYLWSNGGTTRTISGLTAGTYSVTVSNTNCTSVASVTVGTTVDTTDPVISGCPSNISVNTQATQCNSVVSWVAPTATDNCSSTTLTSNTAPGSTFSLGTAAVTYFATDSSGNTATCIFNVTVIDSVSPTALCQDVTVQLDANGTASVTATQIDNGSSDNCGLAAIAVTPSSFNCTTTGANTVTLTVADVNNNISSCTSIVTVEDQIAPTITCPPAVVVACSSDIPTPNTALLIAADNCSGTTTAFASDVADSGTGCSNSPQLITRTYSATDASNNVTNCTQIIRVRDSIPPTITCPANVTVQCGNSTMPSATGTATATDNCAGSSSNVCGNPVVLPLADASGSTEITNCPGFFGCQGPQPAWGTATIVQTTNALTITLATQTQIGSQWFIEGASSNLDQASTFNLTVGGTPIADASWTVTSNPGAPNTLVISVPTASLPVDSCFSIGLEVDAVRKDFLGQPEVSSRTPLYLYDLVGTPSTPFLPTYCKQACSSSSSATVTFSDSLAAACGSTGVITRTWTATDACNNVSTCQQTISIIDTTPPVIVCPTNVVVNNAPSQCGANVSFSANATDLCSAAPLTYSPTSGSFFQVGTTTVTATATDECNNISTCTFTVTVNDNVAPTAICQDVTVQLDANGSASVTAAQIDNGSSDNCGVASISASPQSFNCANAGANTVTLTVTDANNNTSTCTSIVTVQDQIAPSITCPPTVSVACSSDVPASDLTLLIANDNCPGVTTAFVGDAADSGTGCSNSPQLITRTYSATDASSNVTTCTQIIRVRDSIPPTITCPANVTVQCGNSTMPSATGTATATDNCAGSSSNACGNPVVLALASATGSTEITNCPGFFGCQGPQPAWGTATIVQTVSGLTITLATQTQIGSQWFIEGTSSNIDQTSTFNLTVGGLPIADASWTVASNPGVANTMVITVPAASLPADTCFSIGLEIDAVRKDFLGQPEVSSRTKLYLYDLVGTPSTPFLPTYCKQACSSSSAATVTYSDSLAAGCGNTGIINRTWTATDACNNTSTCLQTITVIDTTPPVLVCPPNQVVDNTPSLCGANVSFSANATDLCSAVALTYSPTSGSFFPVGTNTVTATATDACNNISTCTFTVTVNDVEPPNAICKNVTIQVDAGGNATLAAAQINDGSTDNCAIDSMTVSPSSYTCADLGNNTATLTVTDVNSNVSTCTATVTVEDVIPPTAVCQNITLYLDNNGQAAITTSAIDGGSTDNCAIASLTSVPPSVNCADFGQTVSAFLTATDSSGNSSTCTAFVTIEDTTSPVVVCPPGANYDCVGSIPAPDPTIVVATDNCTPLVYLFAGDQTVSGSGCKGDPKVINRTYLVEDPTHNQGTCVQIFSVEDSIAPTITCPADVTLQCGPNLDTSAANTGMAIGVDNCDSETSSAIACFGPTQLSPVNGAGNPIIDYCGFNGCIGQQGPWGSIGMYQDSVNIYFIVQMNVDWRIQDIRYHIGPESSFIPTMQNGPWDTTGWNYQGYPVGAFGTQSEIIAIPWGNLGACYTIGLTATAYKWNFFGFQEGTRSLWMYDSGYQFRNNPPSTPFLYGYCTENCDPGGEVPVTYVDNVVNGCGASQVITRTWTAIDECGYSVSCDQIINVVDTVPPVIVCPANITVNNDPGQCGAIVTFAATATDSCSIPSITYSTPSGSLFPVGTTTVTATSTDTCSNTSTCTFDVTVIDNEAPVVVCQNITAQLDGNGQVSITAADVDGGSTDNCAIDNITATPTDFTCANVGANTVTLTVTDIYSNVSTCTATVTVADTVAPNAVCQNITVQLDGGGNASITASDVDGGSTDNCAIASITANPTTFTCANAGANSVTLTVTDVNNNVSTCTANVTVDDSIAPNAVCQDITVQLDGGGNASITASDVDGGSSDNCAIASITADPTAFTCANVGPNTVTLTVTDVSNNVSTCTAIVTVEDTIAPNAVCQNITVQLDAGGNASIVASDVDGGSTDNCAIAAISATPTSFTCANVGPNSVTLTVTDVNSNVSTCTATVTVEDNIAPNAVCQNITVQLDAGGNASIVAADVDGGSTDNCAIASITATPTAFTCANVGPNSVTLTVTDVNSNVSTCTATVTVEDNIAPNAICQNITVQLDANGNASIVAADVDGGSTDNCAIASITATPTSFDCSNVGPNSVTLTVTDVNNNVDTCNATVTVEDNIAPTITCPADLTLACVANAPLPDPTTATAADNCPGVIVTHVSDVPNAGTGCAGNPLIVTRTYLATDASNNTAVCTQTITIEDTIAPVIVCPADVTLECTDSTDPSATGTATATDNCLGGGGGPSVCGQPVTYPLADINGSTEITNCAGFFGCQGPQPNWGTATIVQTTTDLTITIAMQTQQGSQWFVAGNASNLAPATSFNLTVGGAPIPDASWTTSTVAPASAIVVITVPVASLPTDPCYAVGLEIDAVRKDFLGQPVSGSETKLYLFDASFNTPLLPEYCTQPCGPTSSAVTVAFNDSFTPGCGQTGVIARTWTATDACGNTTSCIQNITIQDTIAPVITCPANLTVGTDPGLCSAVVSFNATATDNCGNVAVSYSPASGSTFAVGTTTVTATATDDCNNVSTCTFDVTVNDTEAPNAVCQNITVQLDGGGNASIVAADVDGGSTDNCAIASITANPTAFTCANVGSNNVTLTVTDVSNNVSTCVATVTVEDTIAPNAVCQNITVQLDGSGNASITASDVDGGSSDNCAIASITANPTAFTCANVGPNSVTLTVTDVNNNVSTCTATVTVEDTVPPNAVCQNITVQLNSNGNATITAADVDGGSTDNCAIASITANPTTLSCANVGPNSVTLTVTDVNNNVSTCTANVSVLDTVPPTAVCQNITVQLDAGGNASIVAADVDGGSSDNCAIASITANPTAFTCANVGQNNVTLTVTDVNNNISTCTAVVSVEDTIAPAAVCQNITVQLDGSGNASITSSDVDGGSSDNCAIASIIANPTAFTCANVGPNSVTLTVTDVNNNVSTCTATVTVEDTVAPNAVCQNITVQLDAGGNASITASDVDGGSTDNCAIASITANPTAFTCANVGPNSVTLTVTDVNNNVSTCTAVVTVEDSIAPAAVCQNITVQLDGSGNASIIASDVDGGSSDNCAIASITANPTAFTCANVGPNSVTLTVTDVNSNVSTCTATVTVEDTVAPNAVCQNITVQLDGSGNATITASDVDGGSTDNCAIASITANPTAFTCANVGPNNVTLTITDVNNNVSTCTAVVTVEDTVAPNAVCQNITVQLDAGGNASITASDVDGGSSDNCAIASITANPTAFTCANVGPNNVTLTVTDVNNNVSTCTAVVTVEDSIAPTAVCQNITVQLDGSGNASITASDVDGGSSDNCAIASITANPTAFTCANVGPNSVSLTVTDVNSNSSTCTATVTVEDTVPPNAVCQNITVQLNSNGNATITAADVDGGSTDNCAIASITANPTTLSCANVGPNSVTLTVTDVNNNVSSCTANVSVLDTVPPVAVCQNITVQLDGSGNASITAADVDGGSSDNCAIASITANPTAFTCANVGQNNVTLTVTDVNNNISTCTAVVTVEDTIAPAAVCQNITVQLDGSGNASITASDVDGGSSDNCAIASITASPTAFTCANVGPNSVTLTVTDVNNNVSTCTATVTVEDTVAPNAVCQNITVQLDAGGNASITASDVDGGSTDNCAIASITANPTAFTCANVGPNSVTLTVTDVNNNVSTCTATVTVEDTVAPNAVCQNITVQLDAGGNASITASDVDGGSSDNCAIASITANPTAFTCANVGPNSVTLTVTDVNNNVSTCTATVTVEDNIAPTIVCPSNIVVNNDPGICGAVVSYNVTPADNCPNFIVAQTSGLPNAVNHPVGVTTNAFTVTDASGNTASCSFTVTVNDNEAPTVNCSAAAGAPNILDNNSFENGAAFNQLFNTDWTRFGAVFGIDANIIPSGQDGNFYMKMFGGNSGLSQDQPIQAGDNLTASVYIENASFDPMQPGCEGFIRLEYFDNTNTLISFTESNKIDNTLPQNSWTQITLNDVAPASAVSVRYIVQMTCTAGGAVMFDNASLTVNSTNVGLVGNISVPNDSGLCGAQINVAVPANADNCGVISVINDYNNTNNASDFYPVGTTVVTWTVTDSAGNTATCSVNITVNDTEAPTIVCPANIVVDNDPAQCTAVVFYNVTPNDNCPGFTVAQTSGLPNGASFPGGVTTNAFTVTDASGNQASCSFTVTVNDTTAPVIDCSVAAAPQNILTNASFETGAAFNVPFNTNWLTFGPVFAIDANIIPPGQDGSFYLKIFGGNSGLFQDHPVQAGDNLTASVYIENASFDPMLPGCQGFIKLEYFDSNNALISFTESNKLDNTLPQNTWTQVTLNDVAPAGAVTVRYVAIMQCSAGGAVFFDDASLVVNPTSGGLAGDITVDNDPGLCGAQIDVAVPFTSDNCGVISVINDLNNTSNASGFYPVGTTTVTWTATDGAGNTASCSVDITVNDTEAPNAVCQNVTVQLDANGNASITAADIDGGSTDNCAIDTITVNPTTFTCANVGANSVTLTVTDIYNNVSTCTASVTVEDSIAPVAVCQNITVQLDASGNANITASDVDGGSSDNCGPVTLSATPTAFTCANVGPNSVTLTVTDASNNTSTCTAIVTVEDNIAPTAVCQSITVQLDGSGNATITASDVDGGSSDNCAIASITATPTAFTCANVGANNVTLTVTDVNNNVSTCTAIVTVEDTIAPNAVCQNITVQLDAGGNATITASDVDGGSTDNCAIASITATPTAFTCADVGPNNVTLTVTDVNNNVSTCTAIVTVEDTIAPNAVCQNITVQLDGSGNATITASDVDGGSNDNCGPVTLSATPTAFTCANVGPNTVTLTVTDASNNMSSCTAIVTVFDTIPPNALCQDVTVYLDNNGIAFVTATDLDGGSTDNCGIASITTNVFAFGCGNVNTNNVGILTVTDVNGNVSTCTSNITVLDTIPPTITCQNITITLDSTGNYEITNPYDLIANVTDNCGAVVCNIDTNVTQTQFTCDDIGVVSVTVIGSDVNGNTSTCTAQVTVTDSIAPVAVCQDVTVHLDANGQATITASDVDGGSYDNCDIILTATPTSFTCANIGINPVVLTAADSSGNSDQCTANVTVIDTIAPVITCPVDLAVTCITDVPVADPNAATATDNCSTVVVTYAGDTQNSGTGCPASPLIITRTYVATDNYGNTATCSQTITVVDTVAPVLVGVPSDTLYYCGAVIPTSYCGIASADSCNTGPGQFRTQTQGGWGTNCNGNNPGCYRDANFAAAFPNGVVIGCNFTLTLTSSQAVRNFLPCGGQPAALNQNYTDPSCIGNVLASQLTAATLSVGFDDNDANFSASSTRLGDLILNSGPLAGLTVDQVLAEGNNVLGGCSSIYSPSQINSALDMINNAFVDGTSSSGNLGCPPATVTPIVTAIDNCDSTVTVVCSDSIIPGNCPGNYQVLVTWTATDDCGNMASATQTITVLDTTAPVITCPANISVGNDPGQCGAVVNYNANAMDDCGTASITYNPASGSFFPVGTSTVTATANDGCNNSASCSFTVTVNDTEAPAPVCQNITVQLTANGDVTIAAADVDGGSTDNCAVTVTADPLTFDCQHVGVANNVTLTATDPSGNTATCTAIVTVVDTTGSICCPIALDFEKDDMGTPLPAGTLINSQWANDGIMITTVNNRNSGPDQAIIFNSSAPTGNDPDLGTPNVANGGPGIGSGGAATNFVAENNILIIAERLTDNNNDGLVDNPDDEAQGGSVRFDFTQIAVSLTSVKLIDLDDNNDYLITVEMLGGFTTTFTQPGLGDNSAIDVFIGLSNVVAVTVTTPGSGGIANLIYCPDGPDVNSCASTLDFNKDGMGNPLAKGVKLNNQWMNLGIRVSANNNNGPDEAIIFNSANPTGGDNDLGTPNQAFGGPGIGVGGTVGNRIAEGNLLIIAENVNDNNNDGRVDNPDDDANGGVVAFEFTQTAFTVDSIVLVDIDETSPATVTVEKMDNSVVTYTLANGGDNSKETVALAVDSAVAVYVNFSGSGAVARLHYCEQGPAILTPCLAVLDFETDGNGNPILAGTPISNQWANYGLTITVDNDRSNGPDQGIIFNSSAPTGGDHDLGTPNQMYSGPGIGSGGITNYKSEGNILIIAERMTDNNNDGLVDNPDDEAQGGTITFNFDPTARVDSITLIDVDDNTGWSAASCRLFNGQTVNFPIPNMGDNGRITIPLMLDSVVKLTINLGGSGSVAALYFCADGPPATNAKVAEDVVDNGSMGQSAGNSMETQSMFTAFPNPFETQTTLRFELASDEDVEIQVYDMRGKLIATLFDDKVKSGQVVETTFQPEDVTDGLYMAKLVTKSGMVMTKKLVVRR